MKNRIERVLRLHERCAGGESGFQGSVKDLILWLLFHPTAVVTFVDLARPNEEDWINENHWLTRMSLVFRVDDEARRVFQLDLTPALMIFSGGSAVGVRSGRLRGEELLGWISRMLDQHCFPKAITLIGRGRLDHATAPTSWKRLEELGEVQVPEELHFTDCSVDHPLENVISIFRSKGGCHE
jgi:hypothetical protein